MTSLPVTRGALWLLGGAASDIALVERDHRVTYGELSDRVSAAAEELGPVRRLVALEATPTLDGVVWYLAALLGEHPVLLLEPGGVEHHADLVGTFDPDVVVDGRGLHEVRPGTGHELHPDLALLLSTSGSTGSPKLVRLSRANLLANVGSIAEYLHLRSTDTSVTSLPLHYCYGLSVLNSHLLVGGTVVLTDLSVADECFWELASATSVTGLAGVPHTFALLDAVDFGGRRLPGLPSLRYLTQAGGRMEPARVREYAELCREHGVDLFVMYGQTEATARIAYLPPELAVEHPDTIGRPIPGGRLHLAAAAGTREPEVGELVYEGPNVMLGYATSSADLALGACVSELRTGDLARRTPEGLFQVLGRMDRQAKVLGHRIDVDRVERRLASDGLTARLVARPECLWAFVVGPPARRRSRALAVLADATGLRGAALRVVAVDALPHTSAGKPDDAALREHVTREEQLRSGTSVAGPPTAAEVRDVYAVVLGRPDATIDDSFVDLGGDSLSYVEVSTRLADRLGKLPAAWPSMAPAALVAGQSKARTGSRWRTVPVDVSVVLRAVAITLVVVTHADLFQLQGGAHVLLAVVGYNIARFQLALPQRRGRILALLRSARAVAVPTFCFVGALVAVGAYHWPTALLLNGAVGGDRWNEQWHFWFLEALVWSYVGLAALLTVPVLDRLLRSAPFVTWLCVLFGALAMRYAWTGIDAGTTERYTLGVVLWCVALGGCAAHASTAPRKLLVTMLAAIATYGFFGDLVRESIVVAGVILLVLARPVRMPARVAAVVGLLAASSLWVYLTHWQVYPGLEAAGLPVLAVLASLAVGIACHAGVTGLGRRCRSQAGAAASAAASRSATTILRMVSIAWVAAFARTGLGSETSS